MRTTAGRLTRKTLLAAVGSTLHKFFFCQRNFRVETRGNNTALPTPRVDELHRN